MFRTALLLFVAAVSLQAQGHHWYYYTVDTTQIAGYSEVAFDSKGALKIAYRRQYQIWYGEMENHAVKLQKADSGTGASAKIAFALDKADRPAIAYHDDVYQFTYLARHDGQKWVHSTIDVLKSGGVDFYHMDMVGATSGGFHIIYPKRKIPADNSLYYARIDAEGAISDSGNVMDGLNGKWNSMTLDPDGKPIFAFFRHQLESIQLSYDSAGTRKIQEIGTDWPVPPMGFYVSLKRDTGNTYYLAYRRKNPHEVRLLHGTPGGNWTDERVDTNLTLTLFNTPSVLGLGKNNAPFVAYPKTSTEDGFVATQSDLWLAWKKDTAWVREIVDSAGIVGEFMSMAVSPEGFPAISYFDRTNRRLRLAVARASAPADANDNGIPDYQEIVSIRKKGNRVLPGKAPKAKPGKVFDSRGKTWGPKAGKAVPAPGIWFQAKSE
ncbi:MAG: hypothetical protein M3Y08_17435 [Fibrobacterota bacterium]|nr:hypothetical protein [Fibrobacterota bacterium]